MLYPTFVVSFNVTVYDRAHLYIENNHDCVALMRSRINIEFKERKCLFINGYDSFIYVNLVITRE